MIIPNDSFLFPIIHDNIFETDTACICIEFVYR